MKTRLLAITALLLCLCTGVEAKKRVIKNPQVVFRPDRYNYVELKRVVMADTAVFVEMNKHRMMSSMSAAGTYIEDEKGTRYMLKGVVCVPRNVLGLHAVEASDHVLVFEPMPMDTKLFDLHIDQFYEHFTFYGIHDGRYTPDIPRQAELPQPAAMADIMQRKGTVVIRGRFENFIDEVQPIISVNFLDDPFMTREEKNGHPMFCLLKRPDGSFSREIELDRPMLVQLEVRHAKQHDGRRYENRYAEWAWLVPGDTAEIVLRNSFCETGNVHYPEQDGYSRLLKHLPMTVGLDAKSFVLKSTQSRPGEEMKASEAKIDSMIESQRGLMDYLVWKYKMNEHETYIAQCYFALQEHRIRTLESSGYEESGCIYRWENLEGYDVLKRISDGKLGKYVFVNLIDGMEDVREVENVLEDMKDSEDFAFVFVARDGAFTERDVNYLKKFRLRYSDFYQLPEEEYNQLVYIGANYVARDGVTLDREGRVMRGHTPFHNEFDMRWKMKYIMQEERKAMLSDR